MEYFRIRDTRLDRNPNFSVLISSVVLLLFLLILHQEVHSQLESSTSSGNRSLTNSLSPISSHDLGFDFEYLTPEVLDLLRLENITGAIITHVDPFSTALSVGIRPGNNLFQVNDFEILVGGDILLKIDDYRINAFEPDNIEYALEDKKAGDNVTLTLFRDNQPTRITMPLVPHDNLTSFIQRLSGNYNNTEAGIQFYLPSGWKGFQTNDSIDSGLIGINLTHIPDIIRQNVSISFSIYNFSIIDNKSIIVPGVTYDTSNLSELLFGSDPDKCTVLHASYILLNGTVGLDIIQECGDIQGDYTKTRDIIGATEHNLLALTFSANSTDLYDDYLAMFNKSLATLQMNNPIDVLKILNSSSQKDENMTKLDDEYSKSDSMGLNFTTNSRYSEFVGKGVSFAYPDDWKVEGGFSPDPEKYPETESIRIVIDEELRSIFTINFDSSGAQMLTSENNSLAGTEGIESSLDRIFPKYILDPALSGLLTSGLTLVELQEPDYDKYLIDGHVAGASNALVQVNEEISKIMIVGTIFDGNAIAIMYASPVATFDQNLPRVENMIRSIKIVN